jgi:hypothetical protein
MEIGLDGAVATVVRGELAKVTLKFEYGFGYGSKKEGDNSTAVLYINI